MRAVLEVHRRPGPDAPASRPLRVLDVTDFFSDTVSGGVKTYLHAKAVALASMGVEHVVVVPGEDAGETRIAGSRLVRVPGWVVPTSRAYRVMLSEEHLAGVLRRFRPDVVEVGSPFIVPHLVRRALGSDSLPTVGFYHADVVRTFAEPYVPARWAAPIRVAARMAARALVRRTYSRFEVTVAASASVARELRELGIADVRCVGLGVDLKTFRPRPPEERVDWTGFGVEPGSPVAIYAGRFCAEKRLDVVLDGHASLPLQRRPHIVLVGGGPHQDRIEARARGQRRLTVLPYVRDREELARLYASADFYLASGPGETFGLSIAEALASGLPAVVVDRGAAPDRVAGTHVGELYRHGDPASAAVALQRLAARLGPGLREEARAHAVRSFDWGVTFASLVGIYRELAQVGVEER